MIGYAIRRENVKLLRKMKYYEHTECLNNYDAIYERYIAARYIDNGTTQMLSNLLRTNRTSTLYFYFSYVKRRIYNSIGFASGREDYHLFMPLLAWLIFCYFCDSTNPRFYLLFSRTVAYLVLLYRSYSVVKNDSPSFPCKF